MCVNFIFISTMLNNQSDQNMNSWLNLLIKKYDLVVIFRADLEIVLSNTKVYANSELCNSYRIKTAQ